MEPKKKSKGDLEKRKNTFFLIGLVIVLSLVYVGFELFATSKNEAPILVQNDATITTIDQTIDVNIKKTPPPPQSNRSFVINITKEAVDFDPTKLVFPEFEKEGIVEDLQEILIIQPEPTEIVLPFAEKMPEFPGGNDALQNYLKKELKYPVEAHRLGVSGNVLIGFVVEKDGRVSNVKVLLNAYPDLDTEALRVVSNFPKWTPGSQYGQAVRVSMQLPIKFIIQ